VGDAMPNAMQAQGFNGTPMFRKASYNTFSLGYFYKFFSIHMLTPARKNQSPKSIITGKKNSIRFTVSNFNFWPQIQVQTLKIQNN
jgi:hypothetical protein